MPMIPKDWLENARNSRTGSFLDDDWRYPKLKEEPLFKMPEPETYTPKPLKFFGKEEDTELGDPVLRAVLKNLYNK